MSYQIDPIHTLDTKMAEFVHYNADDNNFDRVRVDSSECSKSSAKSAGYIAQLLPNKKKYCAKNCFTGGKHIFEEILTTKSTNCRQKYDAIMRLQKDYNSRRSSATDDIAKKLLINQVRDHLHDMFYQILSAENLPLTVLETRKSNIAIWQSCAQKTKFIDELYVNNIAKKQKDSKIPNYFVDQYYSVYKSKFESNAKLPRDVKLELLQFALDEIFQATETNVAQMAKYKSFIMDPHVKADTQAMLKSAHCRNHPEHALCACQEATLAKRFGPKNAAKLMAEPHCFSADCQSLFNADAPCMKSICDYNLDLNEFIDPATKNMYFKLCSGSAVVQNTINTNTNTYIAATAPQAPLSTLSAPTTLTAPTASTLMQTPQTNEITVTAAPQVQLQSNLVRNQQEMSDILAQYQIDDEPSAAAQPAASVSNELNIDKIDFEFDLPEAPTAHNEQVSAILDTVITDKKDLQEKQTESELFSNELFTKTFGKLTAVFQSLSSFFTDHNAIAPKGA